MNQKGHLLGALLLFDFALRYSVQRTIERSFIARTRMLLRKLIQLAELPGFFKA
jgi:hypothetical protein